MASRIVSNTAIPAKVGSMLQRLCQTVANVANVTPMCLMSFLGIVEVEADHLELDLAVTEIYLNINTYVCV